MRDEASDEQQRMVREISMGMAESAFEVFQRQEEQRRQLVERLLEPSKEIERALGAPSLAQLALVNFEGLEAQLAGLRELGNPSSRFQDAFNDNLGFRIEESIHTISKNKLTGIISDDAERAIERLKDGMKFELPDMGFDSIAKQTADALSNLKSFKARIADPSPPLNFMPFHARADSESFAPRPSEAEEILAKLKQDYDALCEEHKYNPSKIPAMFVMLADGRKISIETAHNVGDQTVEIIGYELDTGNNRELTVGIGVACFYADIIDVGPRKPDLEIAKNSTD